MAAVGTAVADTMAAVELTVVAELTGDAEPTAVAGMKAALVELTADAAASADAPLSREMASGAAPA